MTWLPATQRINLKTRHILIAMRLFKDTWHVTSRDTFKIPIETKKKNSQESLIIGNFCGKWSTETRDPTDLHHPVMGIEYEKTTKNDL